MDTKLKKYSPLVSWLVFFLGVNLFIGAVVGTLYLGGHYEDLLSKDYKQTNNFKYALSSQFDQVVESLEKNETNYGEYNNTIYFGSYYNAKAGQIIITKTNSDASDYESAISYLQSKSSDYNYLMFWDGSKLKVLNNSEEVSVKDDEIYLNHENKFTKNKIDELDKYRVVIGVKSNLAVKRGGIYRAYFEWLRLKIIAAVVLLMFIMAVILLIMALIRRESVGEYGKRLAHSLSGVWLEVKVLISILFLSIGVNIYNDIFTVFCVCALILWGYLMLIDLYYNRSRLFSNNSITWLIRIYRTYEDRKPFQRAMMLRFTALTAAEVILIFFTFITLMGYGEIKLFSLIFIGIGIYIYYRYTKLYEMAVADIGSIVDHIELVRGGNFSAKLNLNKASDMYAAAENLNHIQEGIQSSAMEQLKSERMKVELITNVSHDLKTPLTSIVNYIDLLSKENLSPDFANDYVKILVKKVSRLTSLTQDLFDISKAQSGNLELNIERLNIVELIKQSIAEMDEKIRESGLNFKVNLPEQKIYINADGRKLYRVFENLISNILKYSLQNTRAYIDLIEDDARVYIIFKNIACYEMNIDPKEITERFIRGDEARSTEGSGLGLAIVQSFVSLCGGNFKVDIDGDLFKAVVSFNKVE